MPAEPHQHRTTRHWRHQRRNRRHQHHERHHAGELFLRVDIAHQGVNHHACRCRRQTVEETHDDQMIDGLGQCTGNRSGRKDQRPAQNDGLASKAVRHRAIKQLAEGKAENIGAERHLCAARRNAKLRGNHRQRGQVHINRQRHQHGQQAKNEDDFERRVWPGGHRVLLKLVRRQTDAGDLFFR